MIAIKQVNIVNYDLPIKKGDTIAELLSKNQFELFLKEDFVDYYLSAVYEKNFSPNGKRINLGIKYLEKQHGGAAKKFSPQRRAGVNMDLKEKYKKDQDNQLEEPLSYAAMNTLNTHQGAWTNREEMWILEDRRLLFATKNIAATSEWVNILD